VLQPEYDVSGPHLRVQLFYDEDPPVVLLMSMNDARSLSYFKLPDTEGDTLRMAANDAPAWIKKRVLMLRMLQEGAPSAVEGIGWKVSDYTFYITPPTHNELEESTYEN